MHDSNDRNSRRRVLAEGRYARLVTQRGWEWLERTNTSGAVLVAAVTDAGALILVEQERIPFGRAVIELPAGLAGDTAGTHREDLAEAARRELLEETGYEAGQLELVAEGPSSAGLSNEYYALFVASGLRRAGQGGGVESEKIQVHEILLSEVPAWLDARRKAGTLVDPRIYAGLYFLASADAG